MRRAKEIHYQPRAKASLQASGGKSSPWGYDHYLVLKKTGDTGVYDLSDAGTLSPRDKHKNWSVTFVEH